MLFCKSRIYIWHKRVKRRTLNRENKLEKFLKLAKLMQCYKKRIILSVHQLTYDLLDFYQTTGGKILTTIRLHREKAMLLRSLD